MRDRPDIGVVEIEAVRQGAVGEGGEGCSRSAAEQNPGGPLTVPSGRDLADDAAGGLLSSANRDTQPIGEAQPRHIDDLRRQGALFGGGGVGGGRPQAATPPARATPPPTQPAGPPPPNTAAPGGRARFPGGGKEGGKTGKPPPAAG